MVTNIFPALAVRSVQRLYLRWVCVCWVCAVVRGVGWDDDVWLGLGMGYVGVFTEWGWGWEMCEGADMDMDREKGRWV